MLSLYTSAEGWRNIRMEHWRNGSDSVKPKHLDKSLYQCPCPPHILHGLTRKQDGTSGARSRRLTPSFFSRFADRAFQYVYLTI